MQKKTKTAFPKSVLSLTKLVSSLQLIIFSVLFFKKRKCHDYTHRTTKGDCVLSVCLCLVKKAQSISEQTKMKKSGFLSVASTETALVAAKTRSEFVWSALLLPGQSVPLQYAAFKCRVIIVNL